MTHSLFAWQRAVISADMDQAVRLTALRIGLDSSQATGRDVVINDAAVAADMGCSVRTIWRRVQQLLDGGWIVQTAKPTYTGADTGGRRARYQLTIPRESCDTSSCGESDDSAQSSATPSCGKSDDFTDSSATPPVPLAHDTPSRLPNRPESSATATADDGTLSASDGISSSCSHVSIDILASKLRRHTALASLRTDKLKPVQVDEIVALIDTHGDQLLIDRAIRTLRRDDPPQTIQAFLPGWRVMPKPGAGHLAVVPDPPCPSPGHSGTVRHCAQCASEQKAAR